MKRFTVVAFIVAALAALCPFDVLAQPEAPFEGDEHALGLWQTDSVLRAQNKAGKQHSDSPSNAQTTADTSSSRSPLPSSLDLALFYAGPSKITEQDGELEFNSTHVVLSGCNFYKVTDMKVLLGYHSGSASLQGNEHSIYMPELSINLDTNLLALPTIRKVLPSLFDLALLGGAGFGISYLPYYFRTVKDSAGYEIEEKNWYWDHAGWNFHVLGGFVLDKTLGGVIGLYFVNGISGKPKFNLSDIRLGLAYKL